MLKNRLDNISKQHLQAAVRFGFMIHFRDNPEKALEVILWMANRRQGIDFHAVLKLLFFADVRHLNEHGRPIVGGAYHALPYGPVSQHTYDILQRDPLVLEMLGVDNPPFEVRGRYRVHALREPNLRKLTRSEIKALEGAWNEYAGLDFDALTRASHKHPAYKNADDEGRHRMLYEEFLEGENAAPDVIEDLRVTARRIRI